MEVTLEVSCLGSDIVCVVHGATAKELSAVHLSEVTVQGQMSAQCLWFSAGHVHLAQVFTKCAKLLPWLLTSVP